MHSFYQYKLSIIWFLSMLLDCFPTDSFYLLQWEYCKRTKCSFPLVMDASSFYQSMIHWYWNILPWNSLPVLQAFSAHLAGTSNNKIFKSVFYKWHFGMTLDAVFVDLILYYLSKGTAVKLNLCKDQQKLTISFIIITLTATLWSVPGSGSIRNCSKFHFCT